MARQEDLKAIRELFARLSVAWNRGDGEAYADCFTEDADYVTFMGQHLKGIRQIADVHRMLFQGPLKGSMLVSSADTDLQPRFISPDTAIVHAIGEIRLPAPAPNPGDRRSINTNVIVKRYGEWKLTAFHNCRIQEMPAGRS
jgi:uncharacterized protein (TIGR02246 family)